VSNLCRRLAAHFASLLHGWAHDGLGHWQPVYGKDDDPRGEGDRDDLWLAARESLRGRHQPAHDPAPELPTLSCRSFAPRLLLLSHSRFQGRSTGEDSAPSRSGRGQRVWLLQTYEQLVQFHPEVEEYKIYYSQSLFKAGIYPEAAKVAMSVDGAEHGQRMTMLQAAIRYEEDDLPACEALIAECDESDPSTMISNACVRFKEGKVEEARELFSEALSITGWNASVAYSIALCHYQEGDYTPALNMVADIIERGVREHPELSVGSNTGGLETRSVGNTQTLRETALVEAFNLRSAIEYRFKNYTAAAEALSDMPPRMEEELDPVTLHNQGLVHFDEDPQAGLRKLNFLLENPPFPPETLKNLLILYLKNEAFDLAADILAENVHLTYKYLDPDLADFIEATITVQTSPAEAYRKFDMLTSRHIEGLRKFTKHIQDARLSKDSSAIKKSLEDYDQALERYIPVLMGMAKIHWDRQNFAAVERIFRSSGEFASESQQWKLNVAHCYYMQEHFENAIRYYEPIVAKSSDLLDVTAIILANLCVAYIMTSKNDVAEQLMRRIEAAERYRTSEVPDKPLFHLTIVNLAIGALYCAKNNFEFGIGRLIKSLEPLSVKLSTDTWFYAKTCLLGLAEALAKNLTVIKDSTLDAVVSFLEAAASRGGGIVTRIQAPGETVDPAVHNVAHEARLLKRVYLRLRDV
jgi:tetratricopeptide repeat protein 30